MVITFKDVKCDRCNEESKIILPYGPHKFCHSHFIEFFENRVKRTTSKAKMVKYNEKIAVAVSGGKDSMTTLYLLNKLFSETNQIEAIMVDEGIKGYRDKAIEVAINFCETHNIKYHVLSFKRELGVETKQIMEKILFDKKLGSTCAFCGVLRRKLLNEKAKEIGAHKIATGHNLDDECQSIVMNFFDNDLVGLLRTTERMEKKYYDLVPRIKPLYETPEKEVIAYTAICGIEHYSNECCPYSWTSKRSYYRKMLNELEEQFPGTKYKILEMHSRLKRKVILGIQKEIGKCVVCNNPTASKDVLKCSACKQLEKINNVKEGKKRVKENLNLSCTAKYNL
ncbi:MAG: TIGR00269 family protein [Candidatus Diapherotrites archaeon]